MGLAELIFPSVFVPGGTNTGPEMLTLEQLGMYSAKFDMAKLTKKGLAGQNANAA